MTTSQQTGSQQAIALSIYAAYFASIFSAAMPVLALAPIIGTIMAFIKLGDADYIWRSHFENHLKIAAVSVISTIVLFVMAGMIGEKSANSWQQKDAQEMVVWWWIIVIGSAGYCLFKSVQGALRALDARPLD